MRLSTVEKSPNRLLVAGGLSVKIQQTNFGFDWDFLKSFLDGHEWTIDRAHKDTPRALTIPIDTPLSVFTNAPSFPRSRCRKVGGLDDIRRGVERFDNLALAIDMIAESNRIDARIHEPLYSRIRSPVPSAAFSRIHDNDIGFARRLSMVLLYKRLLAPVYRPYLPPGRYVSHLLVADRELVEGIAYRCGLCIAKNALGSKLSD